jgi:AcrR family transcriptional regulator
MSRVAIQMAERRERILEAAREIIAERGFDGLTVRELAQAAGVTAPTIYNLVGSKDQVLVAAVAEQTERFVRSIERAPGDVVPIVEANLRELLRMPRYYRSLLRVLLTSDDAQEARRNVTVALASQLRSALGELAEEGGIEEWVDLDALTRQIQGLIGGASQAWADGALSDEEFVRFELYGVALLMLGATRGAVRREYQRVARDNQPGRGAGTKATVTRLRGRR